MEQSGRNISLILVIFSLISVKAGTVNDCVRFVPESARSTVCDVRQYRATKEVDADRYVQCVLTALGFADESGSIQRSNILAALDAVETHDGVYTDSVDACLSRAKKLSSAERSGSFYNCMLRTESAQNFRDAVELQELRLASKWSESERFDRSKVQQLMRELNSQLQC
uniref:D7 short form salivary protein n=1 Tax=Anopheles epiroticus TaxID=199890 RepID=A0A240PM24_9DIPT